MKSELLPVKNKNGNTAYNPTIPFKHKGRDYIGARVEPLDNELDSQVVFAYKTETGIWQIDDSIGALPLQDPAYTRIKGNVYILGVKVQKEEDGIKWNQEIYRGDSIESLKHFASGPAGMKDIRLIDLEGRVGVFTRPQGKIGYLEVDSVDELKNFTESDWYNAKIIEGLFDDCSWGGVNHAVRLDNGSIGVIGHKAYQTMDNGILKKHYCAIAFQYDPKNHLQSDFKIIAERNEFPKAHSKRSPELDDVIFPAGVDEDYNLYCGLSDFCIGVKKINNPFSSKP